MLVDKPIDELLQYSGRNPRPVDFDAYWEKAMQEMRTVKPDVTFTPAEMPHPAVKCFDMYFTGVGNARIHAKLLRPARQEKPAPAVIFFHGYAGSSGSWYSYMTYASAGFTVAALDMRGQGGLSEDVGGHKYNTFHGQIIRGLDNSDPQKLLFRSLYLDCAQLAYLVMDMPFVDQTRVGVHGGSQGGGLTLACGSLVPEINRIAPIYPFLSDYLRVWEMDLAVNAYAEIQDYFRRFDPRHARHEAVFEKLGYIDIQHLAPRIKAQTLMFTGLMDTTCPPSTQFAAYNKITAPKEYILYPDFGHEYLPDSDDIVFKFMMEMF